MGNKAATKRKTENGEDDIGMDVETARKPTPKAKVKSSDATEAKKASNQANMSGGGTCKNIHEGAENPDSQSESERQADLSSKPSTPKKAKKSPGTKGDKGSSGGDGLPGSPKAIAWTPAKRLKLFDTVVGEANMNIEKWESVSKEIDKTKTQAKDQWRQVLLPKLRKYIADGSGAAGDQGVTLSS